MVKMTVTVDLETREVDQVITKLDTVLKGHTRKYHVYQSEGCYEIKRQPTPELAYRAAPFARKGYTNGNFKSTGR